MTTTTDIGAARSNEFVIGWQLANDSLDQRQVPVPLLDERYPAQGLGKPSDTQAPDTRPSNQLNNIPANFPKKRGK